MSNQGTTTNTNDPNHPPNQHRKPHPPRETIKLNENINHQQNQTPFKKAFKKRSGHSSSSRRLSSGKGCGRINHKRKIITNQSRERNNKKLHYYINNKYHLNENIDINFDQDIVDPIYKTELFKGMKF
eukprot:548543_1